MPVKPIPDGYHSVQPYLMIDGATEAIEFYKKAFGATERLHEAAGRTHRTCGNPDRRFRHHNGG